MSYYHYFHFVTLFLKFFVFREKCCNKTSEPPGGLDWRRRLVPSDDVTWIFKCKLEQYNNRIEQNTGQGTIVYLTIDFEKKQQVDVLICDIKIMELLV